MRTMAAVMMLVACSGCSTISAPAAAQPTAIPVEVWTWGDDGLTQRLADAVRWEFRQSTLFTLAPASTPNALRVSIPTHVGWNEVGGRTRVTYKVMFETAERRLGERHGACWDDDLRECARIVVEQATDAVSH